MAGNTRGGNKCCRVCFYTELEDRADIDQRLLYGESYSSICKDYPHLTKWTLENHKRHMGQPKNEADVAAQLLARDIAKARMADFNVEEFVCNLRERLKLSINKAQCLVEDYLEDVQDGIRGADELNQIITAHQKLLGSLESVGAIKMIINDETAYTKVLRDGYTISSPVDDKANSKLSFKDFQMSKQSNEN